MSKYYYKNNGEFFIEDYNNSKPFSSFLPGLAGLKGIPMWCFYVNRGQGIASFGIENKNNAIMEFSPADQIYQSIEYTGFRTFIKKVGKDSTSIFEPFGSGRIKNSPRQNMYIRVNSFEIESEDTENKINVNVHYYTMPNENFAALVRLVRIKNTSKETAKLEIVDGMPAIIPFGIGNEEYKKMSNTLKAWTDVYNLQNKIPFYKVRTSTKDSSDVKEVLGGNFYLSFTEESNGSLIPPIVDTSLIFGNNTALNNPKKFIELSIEDIVKEKQITTNKVPCGFSTWSGNILPGKTIELFTIIGFTEDINEINLRIKEIANKEFIYNKQQQVFEITDQLTKNIETKTSSMLFDAYCKQCYLDNVIRGGYPLMMGDKDNPAIYHIYSRKHGDLERDYNMFNVSPEYYSQGNGNYRDVNQNRRSDVLFNPQVKSFNIKVFMNLIQTDGYNPLVVKGCCFKLKEEYIDNILELLKEQSKNKMLNFFKESYTPGKLLMYIEKEKIQFNITTDEFVNKTICWSEQNIEAEYHEGFWVDHWTYNMDLIESYLAVYPDKKQKFLFDEKDYLYYDNAHIVLKRKDKYVLQDYTIKQLNSVKEDAKKKNLIKSRIQKPNWMRVGNGKGKIYKATLFEKLFLLILNKFSTLDPSGMGIEMEADKPGWNDALNGLPALFGSSMAETFELKRVICFLLDNIQERLNTRISLPLEIVDFMKELDKLLELNIVSNEKEINIEYWDKATSARETFRDKTMLGFSGELIDIKVIDIKSILNKFIIKLNVGINKSFIIGDGIYPTFIIHTAEDYEFIYNESNEQKVTDKGLPNVTVKRFSVRALPHFLEGPMRAIAIMNDKSKALNMYHKIKQSDIYDEKLKMYKTSKSIKNESYKIGRVHAFTPGWLENESVFMHMEYKYIFSLLKAGLYEEFFEEMKNVMVPFLDPNIYGRSILENSSFIVSSANPDEKLHGTGFVARLSGTTAEFLSIWHLMMAGKEPFYLKDNTLFLELKPILPSWLFDENGKVKFKFLGYCDVTYHNRSKNNTYGKDRAKVYRTIIQTKNGEQKEFEAGIIPNPYANMVRLSEIKEIDIFMK